MDNTGNDFKPFIDTNSTSPYPQGQCTWYVYKRMQQFDLAIGGDLGDAHSGIIVHNLKVIMLIPHLKLIVQWSLKLVKQVQVVITDTWPL